MSTRDDTQRLAREHAAFFEDHRGRDIRTWTEEHWAADIEITNGSMGTSTPLDQWLELHSGDSGFDFDDTGIEVTKVIVGESSFALQVIITPSISGVGFSRDPVPACLVLTVANGKIVRLEEFVDASAVQMPEEFASRLSSA